nr:MAG TPA: hypothetical protein [Caudoviricetes sp.]
MIFQIAIAFSNFVIIYYQKMSTIVFTVNTYRLYNCLSKRGGTNV